MTRKILIVDDNLINRRILTKVLQVSYTVMEASNGLEALKKIKENSDLSAVILDLIMPEMSGYEVLKRIRADEKTKMLPVIVVTGDVSSETEIQALSLGASDFVAKPYNPEVIRHRLSNAINLRESVEVINASRTDPLTGLYNRDYFFRCAEEMIRGSQPQDYVIICFDVDNFKVVNDQYGTDHGDQILKQIAVTFRKVLGEAEGKCGRVGDDNFVGVFRNDKSVNRAQILLKKLQIISSSGNELSFRIGEYIVDDLSLSISAMYDRALLAQMSVKGKYDVHIAVFSNQMRDHLLKEQVIVSRMHHALETGQFEVWYQPQYNHFSKAMIGAEALVRWRSEEDGKLIPPVEFIPAFERSGFIYEMDKYVWETVCKQLRKWMNEGIIPLPVSVNVSRHDVFHSDFYEVITGFVTQYNIPVRLLRLEITESAFEQDTAKIVSIVNRLTKFGFLIEIDDFGSGYSSLNTLKDVPAAILKLDMRFLQNTDNLQRSGSIIESVVRMAKWLNMIVIAEGVETKEQADFLVSVGCSYIQGFLYSKPLELNAYDHLLRTSAREDQILKTSSIEQYNRNTFWDPNSMDTLVFNSFVGGSCILEHTDDGCEMLRINRKLMKILNPSRTMSSDDILKINWKKWMPEEGCRIFRSSLQQAIQTHDEVSFELNLPAIPGSDEPLYLYLSVQEIAETDQRYLFYCGVVDMKSLHQARQKEIEVSQRLQLIMDHANSGFTAVTRDEKNQLKFIFSNRRYYEILGYTKDQFQKEVKDPYDSIPEEQRDHVYQVMHQVTVTGKPDSVQFQMVRRDQKVIWVNANASKLELKGYDDPVELSVLSDITLEKEASQQLQESNQMLSFTNEISHDILAETSADEAIHSMLEKLMKYYGGDRAYIFEQDDENQAYRNTYEVCREGVISEKNRLQNMKYESVSEWAGILNEQKHVYVPDISVLKPDKISEKQLLDETQVKSFYLQPLICYGRVRGFFGIDNPSLCLEQMEKLSAVGDYVSILLTRRDLQDKEEQKKQLEKLQKEKDAQLNLLTSCIPGGLALYQISKSGIRLYYYNEGYYSHSGYSRTEFEARMEKDVMFMICPEDIPGFELKLKRMKEHSEPLASELRIQAKDGSIRWIDLRAAVSEKKEDSMLVNVALLDITSQKNAEIRMQLSEQETHLAMAQMGRMICRYDVGTHDLQLPRRFAEQLGVSEINKISSEFASDLFTDTGVAFAGMLRKIEEGEPEGTIQTELRYADDSIHLDQADFITLLSKDGRPYRAVIAVEDITERHAAESRKLMDAQRTEQILKLVVQHSERLVYRYDIRDHCAYSLDPETAVKQGFPEVMRDIPEGQIRDGMFLNEDIPYVRSLFVKKPGAESTNQIRLRIRSKKQQTIRWYDLRYTPVNDSISAASGIVSFLDITNQHDQEMAYARYQQYSDSSLASSALDFETDLISNLVVRQGGDLLPKEAQMAGSRYSQMLKYIDSRYIQPGDRKQFYNMFSREYLLTRYTDGIRVQKQDFELIDGNEPKKRWVHCELQMVIDPYTGHVRLFVTMSDISAKKRAELNLQSRAETDEMTGLLNRATLEEQIRQRLQEEAGHTCVLVIFDLDNLKGVNDNYGHAQGDAAIKAVAQAIHTTLRQTDIAGRLGGDEFVIFLMDAPNPVRLQQIVQRIITLISQKHEGLPDSCQLRCSAGITLGLSGRDTFEQLYRQADIALYQVKCNGKNNFAFFQNGIADKKK